MRISFVPFLLLLAPVSQCRTPGQTWGGAFKPTGLNTIIRNQCITENKRFGVFHHAGTKEGRAMSKLVGEVAGPVTSKAVLALLLQASGHSKVINCSQRQLNKMEAALAACVRKVQYQVMCRSTTPRQMCLWLQAFVTTCSKDILGMCFTAPGVSYISFQQQRHFERTGIGKHCDSTSVGSQHRTILQKKERPLQLSYSDYLKSVLSQL